MSNESESILRKVVEEFNKKFITKFKGETDPEKILYFNHILDNPAVLNKELAEIPSMYAYWGSMVVEARQRVDKLKNFISMWEASKMEIVITELKSKGAKTPTQKAIDAEMKLKYRKDEKYINAQNKLKEAEDVYNKIFVIEKAVHTKKECLRTIADLTAKMVDRGIYIYKKKGEF